MEEVMSVQELKDQIAKLTDLKNELKNEEHNRALINECEK